MGRPARGGRAPALFVFAYNLTHQMAEGRYIDLWPTEPHALRFSKRYDALSRHTSPLCTSSTGRSQQHIMLHDFLIPPSSIILIVPLYQRAFARIDALLSSVLQFKTHDISVTMASATSSPAQSHRVHSTVPAISRLGKLNPSCNHRALWLLWAFYAKFAERCLGDPKLALYALDRASKAIAGSRCFGRQINPKKSGGRVLVARAQLCQRWPKLVDTVQLEGSTEGRTALESMFVDVTER